MLFPCPNDHDEHSILGKKEDVYDCRAKDSQEKTERSEWLNDTNDSEEADDQCNKMVLIEDAASRDAFANDLSEACANGDESDSIRVEETKEKRDELSVQTDFTCLPDCSSKEHEMYLEVDCLSSLPDIELGQLSPGKISSLVEYDIARFKTAAAPSFCSLLVIPSLLQLAHWKILECTAAVRSELIARFLTRDKTSSENSVYVKVKVSEESASDGSRNEGSYLMQEMHDLHPVRQDSISEVPAEDDAWALSEIQRKPVATSDAGLAIETCSTDSAQNSSSSTSALSCDPRVEGTTESSVADDTPGELRKARDKECKSEVTQRKTHNSGDCVGSRDAGTTKVALVSTIGDYKVAELGVFPNRMGTTDATDSSQQTQQKRSNGDATTANSAVFSRLTKLPMLEVWLESSKLFRGKREKEMWVELKKVSTSHPWLGDCTLKNVKDDDVNRKKYNSDDKGETWSDLMSCAALNPPFGFTPSNINYTVLMLSASHSNAFIQQHLPPSPPPPPPRAVHDGYEDEWRRLASLAYLPPLEFDIYLILLAAAGFYLSEDDETERVKCAFCGVAEPIQSFRDRQPMDVHREISPSCPMVKGEASSNRSIADLAQSSGMRFLMTHRADLRNEPQQSAPASGQRTVAGVPGRATDLVVDGEAPAQQLAVPVTALPTAKGFNELPPTRRMQTDSAAVSFMSAFAAQEKPFSPPPAPPSAAISAVGQTVSDSRQAAPVLAAPSSRRRPRQPVSASSHETDPPTSFSTPPAAPGTERKVVTYEQLGIINQKPVRPDLAVTATRVNTFTVNGWPHGHTHSPDIMADAGFYYTGHADLVRCFYCKGGLKTWMATDNAWIEHARWFPKCPYVRLCKGPKFVEAVRVLNDPNIVPEISMESIKSEIRRMEEEERRNVKQCNRQPTVTDSQPSLMLMTTKDATPGDELGAVGGEDPLPDFLEEDGSDNERLEKLSTRLQSENEEMKSSTICKICQQKQVNVLFLPCGHLIACAQCATALRTCAVCRQQVKGAVRVQTDCDDEDDENDNGQGEAEP